MNPEVISKLIDLGDINVRIPCYKCRKHISLIFHWKHVTDDDMANFEWFTDCEFNCVTLGENRRAMVHKECVKEAV